ncbi:MAG: GDP-mannose 4,6-dehydratase, partial [Candidatus Micrarchaeia archaeon]
DDVVDALLRAVDFPGECFNIGSGRSYSVREVAEIIFKISGRKPKVISLKKGDRVKELVADVRKAKKLLGWEPKVSLEEGLKRSYEGFG